MTETLLEIKDLRTYLETGGESVKAVNGISFEINRGETFCLVGESGSGKSITALSIMQLLPADISSHPSGSIQFRSRKNYSEPKNIDLLSLPDEERRAIRGSRIAMIFQEPMTSLNPVFTIGDQIIEALQLHHPYLNYTQAKFRAIESLKEVNIHDAKERFDDYPHRLSGGQRQRVMIAMAIACEPELLIADEPTTALDVTIQQDILQLMRNLQEKKGMSILFITHDFGVVSKMAHRLAVMRLGEIVECGTLNQVLGQPQHEYTKQLLAALPENLKHAREQIDTVVSSVSYPLRSHSSNETTSHSTPLIELEKLSIYFPIKRGLLMHTVDFVKAVNDVNMQIPQGQILALVGESGSGKTTLGRGILRLIEPTGGLIRFGGEEISTFNRALMQPYRSRMQIIFQDPMSSLNPRLSIATTLTEPMAVHGIGSHREERIELAKKILERVQLEAEHLWRYPHEFSGGQRQRIGIARALVLNPDFIVCDEVTSALDVSVQAEILQILMDLRSERNLTLLFITHDIGVVEYISDETAVMYQGQIVERGLTDQVCNRPRHAYTKKLLSAVPRISTGIS